MDDFSQIIGFIIATIFFIATAIKKNKKKNVTPNTENKNKFTDALESFFGGEFEQNQEPEVNFDEPKVEPHPIIEEEPVLKKTTKSSLPSERHPNLSSSIRPKSKIQKTKPKRQKRAPINLKQAVIYSEILNRKEF